MRFVGSLILCLLLLCGSAQASELANITAATWGTLAGTAVDAGKAGNSGLYDVESSSWTFKAFSASVPSPPASYSAATGYIECATGLSKYIQPYRTLQAGDPLFAADQTTPLNEIWLDLWVRGEWDGTAITSQTTSTTPIAGSSPFYRLITYVNGVTNYTPYGFAVTTQHSTVSSARYQWQLASSTSVVHAGWNRWHRLTLRMLGDLTGDGSALGKIGVYLNGVLVHESTGEMSQAIGAANLRFTMPAVTGVKWQFTGPFQVHSGTTLSLSPCWELDNAPASLVTRIYQPWNIQSAATNGSYFVSGGTGTAATDTEYAISAGSPYRHRLTFSGNGNSPTATTVDEIGTLPYNEQGWGHLVMSDVSAPSGTTLKFAIYTASTTNVRQYWQTTGGFLVYSEDGTAGNAFNVCPWTVGSRYSVVLHLNSDGRAALTVVELTQTAAATFATAKMIYSGMLPNWTPGALGKCILTATTTASNVETGYLAVCRRPSFTTADSLTATSYSASPTIRTPTCVARSFPWGEESTNIPGAYWPMQIYAESNVVYNGMPRRIVIAPIGTAGLTRRGITQGALTGMQHTYGCEIIAIDGGSINDIAEIGTADAAPTNKALKQNLTWFLKLMGQNDNAVWMATMLPRNLRSITPTSVSGTTTLTITLASHGIAAGTRCYLSGFTGGSIDGFYSTMTVPTANTLQVTGASGGGTYNTMGTVTGYTPQEIAAISTFNSDIRQLVSQYQTKGLFSLSDIAQDTVVNSADYPNTGNGAVSPVTGFWSDFTHPNGDPYIPTDGLRGGGIVAKKMWKLKVTPPSTSPPRRPWAYRGTN